MRARPLKRLARAAPRRAGDVVVRGRWWIRNARARRRPEWRVPDDPRGELERLLTENVLRFCDERVVDTRDGGYLLAHDERGQPTGARDKHLVTQARTLYFLSRLTRSRWGGPEHRERAAHGYRFLRERMWDDRHGGFRWCVDPGGANDERKHLAGQAFAILALAEYERATGDRAAGDLAEEVFGLLDERAHDGRFGGYFENRERDWTPEPPGRKGLMGPLTERKTLNAHMHLLTGLAGLVRVRPSPLLSARVAELVLIQSVSMVEPDGRMCIVGQREDWSGGAPSRGSYGHDLENVWMLLRACEALGASPAPLLPVCRSLWGHALAHGYDHARGGFYYEGRPGLPADRRDKVWWVQAESLLSALLMHRLDGDQRYLDAFHGTLDWIVREQADWELGEWYPVVSESGERSGHKAGPWTDSFHEGRALIECLELLEAEGR